MSNTHRWIPCAICACGCLNVSLARAEEPGVAYHPTHVLVRYKPTATPAQKSAGHATAGAIEVLKEYEIPEGLVLVDVPATQLETALAAYKADPNVLHAYRDSYATLLEVPTDTGFSQQWGLHNVGQSIQGSNGTFDADIDAPLAWNMSTGNEDLVIAILDTGVDYNHPDLQGRIWVNEAECPGGFGTCVENGADDDDPPNGFIDDFYGWNFLPNQLPENRNKVRPPEDGGSNHGTLVAGVLAAAANNGGVVGVNWQSRIMILRVCGDAPPNAGCSHTSIMNALEYCKKMNVTLSNNSYGFYGKPTANCHPNYQEFLDQMEDLAIKIADLDAGVTRGHLFVTAAGNFVGSDSCRNWHDIDGITSTGYPLFPASFTNPPQGIPELSNIIAVTATTKTDSLPIFSMYGRESVHLAAPGAEIYTTTFPNSASIPPSADHIFENGTSLAAPYVTGVASLLMSRFPTWTAQQVKDRILETVRTPVPSNPLQGKTVTGGIVNAYRALSWDCNANGMVDACDIDCDAIGCNPANCGGSGDCNQFETNCCVAHAGFGCDDAFIEDSVCQDLSACCPPEPWTDTCANKARLDFPGVCKTSGDGIPDECQPSLDCDNNGVSDACEIACAPGCDPLACGLADDCNGDCQPDACFLATCVLNGHTCDCNANGAIDACDIAAGACDDDDNGVPDDCGACCGDDLVTCQNAMWFNCPFGSKFYADSTCGAGSCYSVGCCFGSQCVDDLPSFDCRRQGGYAVQFCGFGTCERGACCTQSGCEDDNPLLSGTNDLDQTYCSGLTGSLRFVGGANCDVLPHVCATLSAPCSEIEKSRFISFRAPQSGSLLAPPATQSAIRVKLDSMHHVIPQYTLEQSPLGFTACEGKIRWVGPPAVYVESQSTVDVPVTDGGRFVAAFSQSTPHYRNWGEFKACTDNATPREYHEHFNPTMPLKLCEVDEDCMVGRCQIGAGTPSNFSCYADGDCPLGSGTCQNIVQAGETCSVLLDPILHVTGSAIVPNSKYTVEHLAASCQGNEESCENKSAGLLIETQRWGDVVASFQLTCARIGLICPGPDCPSGCTVEDCSNTTPPIFCTTQPDAMDFGAIVNKFKSLVGAPIKAQALLAGDATGVIHIAADVGFTHVTAGVDAFRGRKYPMTPECTTN